MIYYIFNYRDKKLKCFDAPIITTENPQNYFTNVKRSLVRAKPMDLVFARDKALYFCGTFDDEAGKFNILPEFEKLADIEDYCPSLKASEGNLYADLNNVASLKDNGSLIKEDGEEVNPHA